MDGLTELECFSVDLADHIATVTIRRPPVNAQNRQFRDEIIRIFDTLHDTAEVRAIVLTGAGKTFSAGADLKERPGLSGQAGAYPRHNRLVRAAFDCVMECEKPVIAAINGAAIGAGCVLALSADILVASESAFLSMTEVDVGLAGGVRHVLRHFGQSDARLMIMTARRITGPELLRMNVVSACVPDAELMATAMGIARDIAGKVPLAVRAAKRSFLLTEDLPLHEGYRYEQSQTVALSSYRGHAGGATRLRRKAQAGIPGTLSRGGRLNSRPAAAGCRPAARVRRPQRRTIQPHARPAMLITAIESSVRFDALHHGRALRPLPGNAGTGSKFCWSASRRRMGWSAGARPSAMPRSQPPRRRSIASWRRWSSGRIPGISPD